MQKPLLSGFTCTSTTNDVMKGINLSGKPIIVTGGYSGLGLETTKVFARAGARVIVPARNVQLATERLSDIPNAEVWYMDLLNTKTVDEFAEKFIREFGTLHILLNNAGIMAVPEYKTDSHGNELQFATNHLGHFYLTGKLLPALIQAEHSRVVTVSSRGHRISDVFMDDVNFQSTPYDPWLAYGQSKTANALFAYELNKRGAQFGIQSFSVHPGAIYDTNLMQFMPSESLRERGVLNAQGKAILDPAQDRKSIEQGAATQVWCATSPLLNPHGGEYCEDCDISSLLPDDETTPFLRNPKAMRQQGVKSFAVDPMRAEQLWHLSQTLTGLRYL